MSEPRWLTLDEVRAAHERQIRRFGGPMGIRDPGALGSALSRPVNRWRYGEIDLAALAASYAFGLARNHPFVDGNKRTAFVAMMMFLRLNAIAFAPEQTQATAAMLALAAGDLSEDDLTGWIKQRRPDDRRYGKLPP